MAEEKDPKGMSRFLSLLKEVDEEEDYDDDLSGEGSSQERKTEKQVDHTLYVQCFSDAVTIQEIIDAFGKYGKIVGIRMKPEDGSCLVNYARPEEAYAAIQALNCVHTLPGGQHPIRVVCEEIRTIAVGSAESLYQLSMLIKADRERGELKDVPINAVESGELSVESMSWLIMDNLQREELLQMADKDRKRKKPQEGGNEKRGKEK